MSEMVREKFHIVLDRDAIEKKGYNYKEVEEELHRFLYNIPDIPCVKMEGDYYYFEQKDEDWCGYKALDMLFIWFADSKLLAGNFKTLYWWMEDEMYPEENEDGDVIEDLTDCWKRRGYL